jgi:hypothetical protein
VSIAPPVLPVYTQPICPASGYIWTPGYWAYTDDGGYYWVPGTWVEPPEVGFYGGINYGFGYTGYGYEGGYWRDRNFYYNRRVNNVNVTEVHNVYEKNVDVHESHVSYNGGRGGITARPSAAQEKFAHEHHVGPTAAQEQHISAARSDHNQFASVNHGRPSVGATPRPGDFKGAHVVPAKASASERMNNSRTETRARNETKSEAKPRTESRPAPAHEPKTEAKPRSESKPSSTHESKPEAKPRTESRPTTTHEPKTEAKPRTESKPAATHEPKAEAKPRTESKPAPAHESKPEAKPRAESHPTATHESKPAATHESKPPATHESKPPAQHESASHEEKPKR